jgi:hypothetical protein
MKASVGAKLCEQGLSQVTLFAKDIIEQQTWYVQVYCHAIKIGFVFMIIWCDPLNSLQQ